MRTINMKLEKFIEVNGKMMDAVEFTRYIRQKSANKTRKMMQEILKKERENTRRLRELQQLA